MKRISRLLTMAIAIVLVLSLVACGGSPTPSSTPSTDGGGAQTADPGTSGGDDGGDGGQTGGNVPAPGEGGWETTLTPSVLGAIQTGTRKPVEDRLTPIWREKTGVIPNIIEMPRTTDANQWLQMNIAGGTLPDVIAVGNNIIEVSERYQMLKLNGFMKAIPLELAKENMPLTVQRLENLGVKFEDWYIANADEDGNWYAIPDLPNPLISAENRETKYAEDRLGNYPYFLYYRDDILKMVYPDAKTEQEMIDLILEKDGNLTLDDVLDAPVYTIDGWLEYMREVKKLNYKDPWGNFDIIPCHPSLTNVPERIYRSLMTASGIWWTEITYTPAIVPEDKFCNFTEVPSFKRYLEVLNIAYNEGLLGAEFLTQKDDQKEAKMVNGEYAVVNNYFPITAARNKALEEGRTYGWRNYPAFFIDLNTGYQDQRELCYGLASRYGGKSFNPNTVTDEMMPQLLRWVDWNYSEEASVLRAWGTPDMYSGEGEERRFLPEYADVERYMTSGLQNADGKDGYYYGIIYNATFQNVTEWNHEVYGLASSAMIDVYAPMYVYPITAETVNTVNVTSRPVRKYYLNEAPEDKRHFFSIEKAFTQDVVEKKTKWEAVTGEWNDANRPYEDDRNLLMIAAISEPVANFEENYKAFADLYKMPEVVAKEEEVREAYFAYWTARNACRERVS